MITEHATLSITPGREQEFERLFDERVRQVIAQEIKGFNDKLAAHDKIQAWDLLPRELSASTGELTAAGTLRRAVVTERYAAEIESLYRA